MPFCRVVRIDTTAGRSLVDYYLSILDFLRVNTTSSPDALSALHASLKVLGQLLMCSLLSKLHNLLRVGKPICLHNFLASSAFLISTNKNSSFLLSTFGKRSKR